MCIEPNRRSPVRLPRNQRERFAKKAMGYRSLHYTRTPKPLTAPYELLLMIASFKPFDELRPEITHQNKGATAYLVWGK